MNFSTNGGTGRTETGCIAVAEQRCGIVCDALVGGAKQIVQSFVLWRDGVRVGRLQFLQNDHGILRRPARRTQQGLDRIYVSCSGLCSRGSVYGNEGILQYPGPCTQGALRTT